MDHDQAHGVPPPRPPRPPRPQQDAWDVTERFLDLMGALYEEIVRIGQVQARVLAGITGLEKHLTMADQNVAADFQAVNDSLDALANDVAGIDKDVDALIAAAGSGGDIPQAFVDQLDALKSKTQALKGSADTLKAKSDAGATPAPAPAPTPTPAGG